MKKDPTWMYLSDAGHIDHGWYLEANWIKYLFWWYRVVPPGFPVEVKPQLQNPYRTWAFNRLCESNNVELEKTIKL